MVALKSYSALTAFVQPHKLVYFFDSNICFVKLFSIHLLFVHASVRLFWLVVSLIVSSYFILCIILIEPRNLYPKFDLSFQQVPVSLWAEMQWIESDWVSCKSVSKHDNKCIKVYICWGLIFIIMEVHTSIHFHPYRWKTLSFSINLSWYIRNTQYTPICTIELSTIERDKTIKQTILFQTEEHVLMFCCDSTINKPFTK